MDDLSGLAVIMPTHNRAGFIEEALRSLARQTRPPDEVVVIDDGSTDATAELLDGIDIGAPIRCLRHDSPRGASESRNRGAAVTTCDVITFLDSDDILEPAHHESALRLLEAEPDVALFCNDSRVVGPDGEWLSGGSTWTDVQCGIKGVSIQSGRRSLGDIFLFSTAFPGMTLRREDYLAVGGLDQSLFPLDDYDLQLRVAASGRGVYYAHVPLARYRMHGGNESGSARSVRVGEQKLVCLEQLLASRGDWTETAGWAVPEDRVRERLGELRRELAVSRMKAGQPFRALKELAAATIGVPNGGAELAALARRAVGKRWGAREPA